MRKHENLSKGEELLVHALEECLEEDLSFIPPEREIARNHRFSEEFEQTMEELMEDMSEDRIAQDIRKHFSWRYGQWAACILVFFLCGGLLCYVTLTEPFHGKSAADTATGGMEEAAPTESFDEEAVEMESENQEMGEALAPEPERVYCGQVVYLAEQQELPEVLDHATTLVNCPVQDEEDPVLFLTIGNTGEEDIKYLNRYSLEVWLDGAWYVIPARSDEEEEWLTLEAGMAVDVQIDLSDYRIDYGAWQYRLVTFIGQDQVSAEFTFEGAFVEKMERLEE